MRFSDRNNHRHATFRAIAFHRSDNHRRGKVSTQKYLVRIKERIKIKGVCRGAAVFCFCGVSCVIVLFFVLAFHASIYFRRRPSSVQQADGMRMDSRLMASRLPTSPDDIKLECNLMEVHVDASQARRRSANWPALAAL